MDKPKCWVKNVI